ncbi:hypothetical protein [Pajaroellobacter abortibovis]|uniref:Uncharacterized protein n=1 Tax=Pajaroellobacter abortibovis TaxID=1882918 RepID=A0A1L6MX44_9BACT|nr:hypothetical protein [Pajaroellobacter abortibovis]APS00117.1 hypothetical protein BCY86_05045 [Pajaroellobacter abortibovis]
MNKKIFYQGVPGFIFLLIGACTTRKDLKMAHPSSSTETLEASIVRDPFSLLVDSNAIALAAIRLPPSLLARLDPSVNRFVPLFSTFEDGEQKNGKFSFLQHTQQLFVAFYSFQPLDVAVVVKGNFESYDVHEIARRGGFTAAQILFRGLERILYTHSHGVGWLPFNSTMLVIGTETRVRLLSQAYPSIRGTFSPWLEGVRGQMGQLGEQHLLRSAFDLQTPNWSLQPGKEAWLSLLRLQHLQAAWLDIGSEKGYWEVAGRLLYPSEAAASEGAAGIRQITDLVALMAGRKNFPKLEIVKIELHQQQVLFKLKVEEAVIQLLLQSFPMLAHVSVPFDLLSSSTQMLLTRTP